MGKPGAGGSSRELQSASARWLGTASATVRVFCIEGGMPLAGSRVEVIAAAARMWEVEALEADFRTSDDVEPGVEDGESVGISTPIRAACTSAL